MRTIFQLITLLLVANLTGCAAIKHGASETVTVESFPSGANVYLDDDFVDVTPLTLNLSRKLAYQLRFEKDGYKVTDRYLIPQSTQTRGQKIQVGFMEDLGFYNKLSPNPMRVELVSTLVPTSKGADPYTEFATRVLEAHSMFKRGQIGPSEHKYIVNQLTEFYSE